MIGKGKAVWMFMLMGAASVFFQPFESAWAESQSSAGYRYSFAVIFENDSFMDTDRAYTSGLFAALSLPWEKPDSDGEDAKRLGLLHRLTDSMTQVENINRERRVSFAFGQTLITPDDIEKEIPPSDELPYAAFLTAKMMVQYQNEKTSDSFGALVGVVGPCARGEESQKAIHKMIGVTRPKGWKYQLKDEPILNVSYVNKWKIFDTLTPLNGREPGWDLTGYTGGDAGNLLTDVDVGAIFRIGNGANRYPSAPYKGGVGFIPDIDYDRRYPFLINLMGGIEISYVLHSMIVDGNTFKEGPELERVPFCGDVFGGLGFGFKGVWASLVMVRGTKIHEAQKNPLKYGSMTLGFSF